MTDPRRIAALDAATLVYLDALLRARHVSRAAKIVGLSQPAMSRALARARSLFEDELLERGPRGALRLTERARLLSTQVRDALAAIEAAVGDPPRWAPLTVAASACARALIVPALVSAWAKEERLGLLRVSSRALDRNEGALRIQAYSKPGAVQIGSWPRVALAPASIAQSGPLDRDEWASLGHVHLGEGDEADLDAWTARRSIARIEDLSAALQAAASLQAAITLPAPLAASAEAYGLAPLKIDWSPPPYRAWAIGPDEAIGWARRALADRARLDARPRNEER